MSRRVYTRTASGKTKRRRSRHGPPFIQLFHWMIDLPVWHSLSPRAVVAYLELARRYNGSNNGWLHLSVRELARAWNWSRASAGRAIEELVEKGFVEITRASGFNMKDRKRQAAEYRLTVLFCDCTRQPASKTFTKWEAATSRSQDAENISRSQNRATTVSLVRPSLQNIEENASTVSPARPWRRFSGISRSHP
jgi:MarR family protein